MFDCDCDGLLSREELATGVGLLVRIEEENTLKEGGKERGRQAEEEEEGEEGREREDAETEGGETAAVQVTVSFNPLYSPSLSAQGVKSICECKLLLLT